MKFAAAKFGNLYSIIRFIVFISWMCAGIQLPAQILSFETEVIEAENFDGIYQKTIETHDSGFLFLTSSQVTKINRKGKILWQYEFKDGSNPLPQYPFYPAVGSVFDDKEGVYLHGMVYSSPYYLKLNHFGEFIFDTVYLESWKDTLAPFNENRNIQKDGNYFLTTDMTFENLWFDSLNNRWEWDERCYAFHKLDKFGNRISSYYRCLSDTSQYGGGIIKINSDKKEYLLLMQITPSPVSKYRNNYILVIDSIGKIIKSNLLPEIASINRFDKLYGPDEGEGACLMTNDFHYYLNKEGELVKQVPVHEVETYGIRIIGNINYSDSFGFFDSSQNILWKDRFERVNLVIKNDEGREFALGLDYYVPYNHTYRGLLRIYEKIISAQDNFKFGYILIHINKEGWPIGYDPDELPPDEDTIVPKPTPKEGIWFTQSGDLRFPPSLSDWQFRVSDMAGKTLLRGEVPPDGIVSMPPLATGIYVVQCHNPATGEKENRKVFKAKG